MKVDPTPAAPGAVSSSTYVALREHARNSLRPIVEALDQQMTALPVSESPPPIELR